MKLSFIKKSLTALSTGLLTAIALVTLSGSALAIQIPYEDIGTTSIDSPVFNTYTNVPNGIGNEADFVRIRKSTGDVADNQGGARNFEYVNGLNADCNVGDKYDVRSYVHNGADDDFNDNGTGSGVASGTNLRMVAPLNTLGKTHTFTTTISATDVSPVTDTARLYCQSDEDVMLKLVPSSVKVYSSHYGYQGVSDSAVNGVLPIGSRVAGSGDVWGCWGERVIVAYIVEVVEIEKPATPIYTCDLLSLTFMGDRKYKFDVTATAKNGAVVKEYRFDFNDGSAVVTSTGNVIEHQYAKDGKYSPKAEVVFNVTTNGVTETKTATGASCAKEITISTTKPMCEIPGKGHLPKDSPECSAKCEVPGKGHLPKNSPECKKVVATTIPNTGAGTSIAIIVTAVSAIGAYAHRAFTLKRQ